MCYAPIIGIGGTIMALSKSVSMAWVIALAVVLILGLICTISAIAMPLSLIPIFERLREYASWLNYEMQVFDMRKYVITLEHTYYISGYVPRCV